MGAEFFTWFFTCCGLNCDQATGEAHKKTHPGFSNLLQFIFKADYIQHIHHVLLQVIPSLDHPP